MEETTETTETAGTWVAMHPVPAIGGATLLGVLGGYLSRRLYKKGPTPMVVGGLLGAAVGTVAQYFAWKSAYAAQIAVDPDLGFFQREPLKGIVRLGAGNQRTRIRLFFMTSRSEREFQSVMRLFMHPDMTPGRAFPQALKGCFPAGTNPRFMSTATKYAGRPGHVRIYLDFEVSRSGMFSEEAVAGCLRQWINQSSMATWDNFNRHDV